MPPRAPPDYRFADLVLEASRRRIRRGNETVPLTGLPFAILRELLEAAPALVTHDELIRRAWGPGRIVTPESVAQNIKRLRKALGDDASNPYYIEGIRGEGYRVLPAVKRVHAANARSESDSPARPFRNVLLRRTFWAVAVLTVAGAGWAWLGRDMSPGPSASPRGVGNVVAVLPYSASGASAGESQLGTLIAEEISDGLAEIEGLRVIADRSLSNLADADTLTIGRSLGVDYIVEGTLIRDAGRLRIRSLLVDARTGVELWSDSYETGHDPAAIPIADIARRVVMMLGGITGTARWGGAAATGDVRTLEDILGYLGAQGPRRTARLAALGHLESAVRREPDNAVLRAVLSVAYNDVASTTADRATAARYRARARDEIDKAFDLAPDMPFVLAMSAGARAARAAWHQAAALFDRLVEISEPDTFAHDMYDVYGQFLRSTGRLEEARAHFEYRRRIAPGAVDNNWRLIEVYAALGDFEAAFELAGEKWQDQMFVPQAALAAALGARDRDRIALWVERLPAEESGLDALMADHLDEAAAALGILRSRMAEADQLSPTGLLPISSWAAYFGDHALALEALAQMPDDIKGTFVTLQIWRPVMAEARQLPAFRQLVDDIGLVAYWREWGWPTLCRPVGDDFACDRVPDR